MSVLCFIDNFMGRYCQVYFNDLHNELNTTQATDSQDRFRISWSILATLERKDKGGSIKKLWGQK
jgi:hypothetical protein